MAFHWQTFRTRALTALVFAAVMLAGLLWNQWSFFLLFSVIHFGCWWEYFNLLDRIYQVRFHIYTRLGFMLLGYAVFLWFCGPTLQLGGYWFKANGPLPVSVAGFIMTITGLFLQKRVTLQSFAAAALGIFYISLSWGLLMDIYSQVIRMGINDLALVVTGVFVPLIIIASIWINDTMAYLVGSFIGRRPLSKISPKKTWEGTIGGIILSVSLMGWLYPYLVYGTMDKTFAVLIMPIALIASVAGTFGDLLESKLKRKAGVKDSGSIMPGHGGFLDRFDSLLIAIPVVWVYLHVFLEKTLRMLM